MADTRGMADLYKLDIDKIARGFGQFKYNFLEECRKVPMKGDHKRWFQKTAGTLTAVTPSATSNVSPGSKPAQLEVSWTRDTAYSRKFFVEGTLDQEDIDDAEIDTLMTTIEDLTEVVVRDRDAHIWDIMSESQSPSLIQTFATTAVGGDQWDAASAAGDPVADIERAKKMLQDQGYEPKGASLLLDTTGYESLINWLVAKGTLMPNFISEKIKTGQIEQILNLKVKVSLNITTDFAMVIGNKACTYAENKAIHSNLTKNGLVSTTFQVACSGVAYVTDPKDIVLITDINT